MGAGMKRVWKTFRGWPRWVQIVIAVVVLAVIIGAASNSKKKPTAAQTRATAALVRKDAAAAKREAAAKAREDAEDAKRAAAAERAKMKITLRIPGVFDRSCSTCFDDAGGDLESRLSTTDVWCGWQHDKVVIHATMKNSSVEHVTVVWNPIYTVQDGGLHGDGISSQQNSGFDAGQTRSLLITQSPKGVTADSPLQSCAPSFWDIKSG